LNWFRAPDGHFWYWSPADEDPPPYAPHQEQLRKPAHALVPKSTEEMSRFIQVLIMRDDGMYAWQGDYMSEFPFFFTGLSKEDKEAWSDWKRTEPVQKFLQAAIQECQIQSTINKDATGWATIRVGDDNGNDAEWVSGDHVVNNPLRNKH
jgi:hypothetical protein